MRIRLLALAALLVPIAGCSDLLSTSTGKTGFVALTTYDNQAGGFSLLPLGAFFARSDITFAPANLEACQIVGFAPGTSLPGGVTLDAGPRIVLNLPARADTLFPNNALGPLTYFLLSTAGIPHTPGDTITAAVPGGPGFPEAFARLKTAEPFSHDPVGLPPEGEPLTIRWSDPAGPGSIMMVSLRYASATSIGGEINEQIFCAFNDDGDGTIPSFLLPGWTNPDPGVRASVLTRIRVQEVQIRSGVRFTLTSAFDVPTPLANP